jgi:hypothetical protein
MADEKRELTIEARVKDFASRTFVRIGRAVKRFGIGAINVFRRVARSVLSLRTGLVALGTAALSAFAFIRGGRAFGEIVDGADAMSKLARSVNSSTEAITELATAFSFGGIDAERFRSIITGLGRGISQAIFTGRGPQLEAFREMGISVEELKDTDPVELFDRMAGALEGFNTVAERSAVLQRIFPDNFQRLIPLIGQGQEAFREAISLAQFFGASISTDLGNAAEKFADAMLALRTAMEAVGRTAVLELAQKLAPVVERIAVFISQNRAALIAGLKAIIELFIRLGVIFLRTLIKILAFISTRGEEVIDWLERIPFVGNQVADTFADLFNVQRLDADQKTAKKAIRDMIDELHKLEQAAEENQLGDKLVDNVFSPELGAELDRQIANLTTRIKTAIDQFNSELTDADPLAFFGGGGIDFDAERQAAQARGFGDLLAELQRILADPSRAAGGGPDISGILKVLFGEEGPEGAKAEVTSFFDGFGDQIDIITKKWTDFATAGAQAATTLLDGGLNAMVEAMGSIIDGTATAKEAFKTFAKSLLSDLARIISRLIVMKALQTFLGIGGFAKGGVAEGVGAVTSTVSAEKFATGGIARRPTLALFGEGRNAEAFVPLPDNRSIPVTFSENQRAPVLNITIQAMDSRDVTRLFLEQKNLLRRLWENDMDVRNHSRQTVQRAAS